MPGYSKVKIVVLAIGPDYYTPIRDKLLSKGIECELIKLDSFCLLFSSRPRDEVNRLRKVLRTENDELVVFFPNTTELFLEEPDLTILYSGYRSWHNPERVKIIPYVWQPPHSPALEAPQYPALELRKFLWTKKPDLSVGFLGASHEDRKIVRIAGHLPLFLKRYIIRGRHLKYVYASRWRKIPSFLAWMPCFARMEAVRKLENTSLKKDVARHVYKASNDEQANYQRHMMRNTYILCPRGFENFSYRFYETLACGRIPVLIDTDTVLPPGVNWDELCVRVPFEKLHDLENAIMRDFEANGEAEFILRQRKAIKLMEELRQLMWLEEIIEDISKAAEHKSNAELLRH
jgi:hypothetical protein